MDTTDRAIVRPSFVFGLSRDVQGNVAHLEGNKVLFPVGHLFAMYDPTDTQTTFFAAHDVPVTTSLMAVSHNRKYLATAEQLPDTDTMQVSVYNLSSERRVRTLPVPTSHTASREVVGISFSGDGKLLTMACGAPDWAVVVWKWYSSKVVAVIEPEMQVTQVAANPWDESALALAAPGGVRTCRVDVNTGSVRSSPLMSTQSIDSVDGALSALTWAVGQHLVLGTSTGALAVMQETTCAWSCRLPHNTSSPAAVKAATVAAQAAAVAAALKSSGDCCDSEAGGDGWRGVQQLSARGRGFVAAGGYGEVWVYDPAGDGLSKRHTATELYICSYHLSADCPGLILRGLSVSTSDEQLALTTEKGQLLLCDLSSAAVAAATAAADPGAGLDESSRDALAEADQVLSTGLAAAAGSSGEDLELDPRPFTPAAGCFPGGRLVALDAITHPPQLLAVTEARTLHLWDWLHRTSLVAAPLLEEPLSCALHPGGTMALVGSAEQLRLYQLLRHDIRPLADIPVRKCSLVRYSPGGHAFAAVGRNNAIIIYPGHPGCITGPTAGTSSSTSSHTNTQPLSGVTSLAGGGGLTPLAVLKAHVSTVTDLAWARDGAHLVSVGAGGAVYWWEVGSGTRLMELEYVDKACVYTAVCYSDRHKAAIVRTLDGRLQHISGGRLRYEVAGLGQDYAPMVLAADGRLLLVGSSSGSVWVLPWPKEVPSDEAPPISITMGKQLAARPASRSGPASAPPGPLGAHSMAGTPRSGSPRRRSALWHSGGDGQQGLGVDVGGGDSPRSSATGYAVASPRTPGRHLGGTGSTTMGAASTTSGGAAAGGGSSSIANPQEFWLHAGRLDCLKLLASQGVVFTAGTDGVIIMSLVTLVLDDTLLDPPAALAVSAMASARRESGAGLLGTTSSSGGAGSSSMRLGADAGSSLPSQVMLVPEQLIQALGERLREAAARTNAVKKEAGFQLMRQTMVHRDKLAVVEGDLAAAQAALRALRAEFETYKVEARAHEQQVVAELEALHSTAADELSALYEARLALEAERAAQAAAARDDAVAAAREAALRDAAATAKQLEELHVSYRSQLLEAERRYASLKQHASEAEAAWEEMVGQAEADLEAQAERDGARLAQMSADMGETFTKLRAEVNLLKRNNLRLKADKAADLQKMEELAAAGRALRQQLADSKVTADKLRAEITERDAVISDNYNTLQALRRRCQELETHKFVLGYKADQYHAQLAPAEEAAAQLAATVAAQDKELLTRQSALSATQRAASDKEAAVRRLQGEVWGHKQRADKLQARLDTFAHELWQVMQEPDDVVQGGRTRRGAALEALVGKYCGPRAPLPPTGPEVEGELARHVLLVERKAEVLGHQLEQARADHQLRARKLLQQNAVLLRELAEVVHTNKELAAALATAGQAADLLQGPASTGHTNSTSTGSPVPAASSSTSSKGAGRLQGAKGAPGSPGGSSSPTRPASKGLASPSDAAGACSASSRRLESPPGRTCGVATKEGLVLPGSAGRTLTAAVAADQGQLALLQSALAASQQVVTAQAALLSKLQAELAQQPAQQPQQHSPSRGGQSASPAHKVLDEEGTVGSLGAAGNDSRSPATVRTPWQPAGALQQMQEALSGMGVGPPASPTGAKYKAGPGESPRRVMSPLPGGEWRSPAAADRSSPGAGSPSAGAAGGGLQAAVKQDLKAWRSRRT